MNGIPSNRSTLLNQVASPAREPMLRILLDELDKETMQTTELVATIGQRLEPIMEIVPDLPDKPTAEHPRPTLAHALESLRDKVDRVKMHNRLLLSIRNRLEV